MIPKKSSSLYKEVAESLDCAETLVEDIVEFYYNELRKTLSSLSYPRINVDGLGHFVAKTGLVKKSIPKYTNILKTHDTSTYGAYFNKKMIENKLELLIQLEHKISLQEIKKEEFKKTKYESGTKDNLGE
jgi:4-alpha-glucanotransferase